MGNTHNTLSIDSHVNLASRVTAAEASAFMRPFNLTIETESGDPFQIRYFQHRTQRSHRVTASASEMEQDPTWDWSQQLTDLFPWAIAEVEEGKAELSGRLLGDSGRVDG